MGYVLSGTNICSSKVGCNATTSNACTCCADGYYLDIAACKTCAVAGCKCTGASDCTDCVPEYYFNGTTCIASPCCNASASNVCFACKTGYALIRGACR